MPAWIHSRAEHILTRNPDMKKSTAFAIATQQSHAVKKTPRNYGTTEGRATARAKYDSPKEYKKTAMPAELLSSLKGVAGAGPRLGGQLTNVGQHLGGAGVGQVRSAARKGTLLQNVPAARAMVRPLAVESDPFGKLAFAAFLNEIQQIKQAGALGPAVAGAAAPAPAAPATQTGGGTPVPPPASAPPNPALAGGGQRALPTMTPHPNPGSPNVMFAPKPKLQPPPMSGPKGR